MKKIFLKTVENSKKKKHLNIFGIKKDIETVQKLNFKNDPISENSQSSNLSRNKKKMNLFNDDDEEKKPKHQTDDDINTLAISIRKIKTYYPNIKDEVFNENYTNGQIPSRTEHINFETKLKLRIQKLSDKENELKIQQLNLENSIENLDKLIADNQLNIEVINNVDNNTSKLEKKFTEKVINDMNKNLKSPFKKNLNFLNTKEFQEQLNLYLLREEYNSNQKIKEIKESITNNKNIKIEKIKELDKINNNLKEIHENKKKEIEELYMHYLNILKDGKDTRNEGLSWIIREIFNLDKKVIISFFPKFLDKLCIQYLFNITHINMEITEIEKQIKMCKKDFKDNGIIKNVEINESEQILTQRNNATKENLKKLKKQFALSFNKDKKYLINNKNNKNNKNSSYNKFVKKIEKKSKMSLNNISSSINSIKRSFLNINTNNDDKKNDNNLPYINGDPNHFMGGQDQESTYENNLLKNELLSSLKIPPILKVKDFAKMSFSKNYFTSNDIVKVNHYFNLRRNLNLLREEKDILKTNEMDRIFKEFQRNNYEKRYNVNKIRVISALIGEDNIKNELFRQEKREKLYNDQISKSQLHNNSNKLNIRTFNEKQK